MQWRGDLAQRNGGVAEVAQRGADVLMAEQLFKSEEAATVVQIVDGEAVAEGMRADFFAQFCAIAGAGDDVLDASYGDAFGRRFCSAGNEIVGGFYLTEVVGHGLSQAIAVGDYACFLPLCVADGDGPVLAVEVAQPDLSDLAGT